MTLNLNIGVRTQDTGYNLGVECPPESYGVDCNKTFELNPCNGTGVITSPNYPSPMGVINSGELGVVSFLYNTSIHEIYL